MKNGTKIVNALFALGQLTTGNVILVENDDRFYQKVGLNMHLNKSSCR